MLPHYRGTDFVLLNFFFLILEDASPLCGATDTLFWSSPGLKAIVDPPIACFLACGVQWMLQIHL